MNAFEYQNPVRIVFGAGKVQQTGQEVKAWGARALVVSYTTPLPAVDLVCASLKQAGVAAIPFFEVEPNPTIQMVARGVAVAKQVKAEVVVGVGGGSAMDAAKAIAAGALYPQDDLWQMVYSRHDLVTAKPPEKALPLVMVPTLPATGSEMNKCSVVTHTELNEKSYIWADCLFPKTAILDPELTYSLPPFQTACGAIDAISHVLEIYINGQPKSDLLHAWQEGVMKSIISNLPVVLKEPAHADARAELMWCATCALNGWASPGDAWTPMHQVGHVLTTRHKVNHGTSLALVMPSWMTYFAPRQQARFTAFEKNIMPVEAFKRLIKDSGVPTTLSEVGVTARDLPAIVADVKKISFNSDGVLGSNPPATEADLLNVLKLAL